MDEELDLSQFLLCRATIQKKIGIIEELSCQKEKLTEEVRLLENQCLSLKTELDSAVKAKEAIESDSQHTKRCFFILNLLVEEFL